VGQGAENMKNHSEPQVSDALCDTNAYNEMEYRLKSLRSLVCDLLKTNQELRDALLDAGIDTRWPRSGKFPGHAQAFRLMSPRPPAEVKP
jgi:hypothetical protein